MNPLLHLCKEFLARLKRNTTHITDSGDNEIDKALSQQAEEGLEYHIHQPSVHCLHLEGDENVTFLYVMRLNSTTHVFRIDDQEYKVLNINGTDYLTESERQKFLQDAVKRSVKVALSKLRQETLPTASSTSAVATDSQYQQPEIQP
jgi:hypothetical protein